ncbi:unnamed protein product [Protopolystoma xenopodis]|uniref:Uncharacterized protein n=1 Tax=Protopolystoma xenopodis TaxID=117903 RepID=A0A3S5ANZ8_9PLAT|nr:unnamed protein product [Protopolystoma xenopodis]
MPEGGTEDSCTQTLCQRSVSLRFSCRLSWRKTGGEREPASAGKREAERKVSLGSFWHNDNMFFTPVRADHQVGSAYYMRIGTNPLLWGRKGRRTFSFDLT